MANHVTCCVAKPDDAGTKMRFVMSLKVPRTKAEDKSKNIKEWSLAEAELGRSRTLCE